MKVTSVSFVLCLIVGYLAIVAVASNSTVDGVELPFEPLFGVPLCPSPPKMVESVWKVTYWNMSFQPVVGAIATLHCHFPQESPNPLRSHVLCQPASELSGSPHWNDTLEDIVCEEQTCDATQVHLPTHGELVEVPAKTIELDKVLRIRCAAGFRLVGCPYVVCSSNGWVLHSHAEGDYRRNCLSNFRPRCVPAPLCPPLPQFVPGGRWDLESKLPLNQFALMDTATLECWGDREREYPSPKVGCMYSGTQPNVNPVWSLKELPICKPARTCPVVIPALLPPGITLFSSSGSRLTQPIESHYLRRDNMLILGCFNPFAESSDYLYHSHRYRPILPGEVGIVCSEDFQWRAHYRNQSQEIVSSHQIPSISESSLSGVPWSLLPDCGEFLPFNGTRHNELLQQAAKNASIDTSTLKVLCSPLQSFSLLDLAIPGWVNKRRSGASNSQYIGANVTLECGERYWSEVAKDGLQPPTASCEVITSLSEQGDRVLTAEWRYYFANGSAWNHPNPPQCIPRPMCSPLQKYSGWRLDSGSPPDEFYANDTARCNKIHSNGTVELSQEVRCDAAGQYDPPLSPSELICPEVTCPPPPYLPRAVQYAQRRPNFVGYVKLFGSRTPPQDQLNHFAESDIIYYHCLARDQTTNLQAVCTSAGEWKVSGEPCTLRCEYRTDYSYFGENVHNRVVLRDLNDTATEVEVFGSKPLWIDIGWSLSSEISCEQNHSSTTPPNGGIVTMSSTCWQVGSEAMWSPPLPHPKVECRVRPRCPPLPSIEGGTWSKESHNFDMFSRRLPADEVFFSGDRVNLECAHQGVPSVGFGRPYFASVFYLRCTEKFDGCSTHTEWYDVMSHRKWNGTLPECEIKNERTLMANHTTVDVPQCPNLFHITSQAGEWTITGALFGRDAAYKGGSMVMNMLTGTCPPLTRFESAWPLPPESMTQYRGVMRLFCSPFTDPPRSHPLWSFYPPSDLACKPITCTPPPAPPSNLQLLAASLTRIPFGTGATVALRCAKSIPGGFNTTFVCDDQGVWRHLVNEVVRGDVELTPDKLEQEMQALAMLCDSKDTQ